MAGNKPDFPDKDKPEARAPLEPWQLAPGPTQEALDQRNKDRHNGGRPEDGLEDDQGEDEG